MLQGALLIFVDSMHCGQPPRPVEVNGEALLLGVGVWSKRGRALLCRRDFDARRRLCCKVSGERELCHRPGRADAYSATLDAALLFALAFALAFALHFPLLFSPTEQPSLSRSSSIACSLRLRAKDARRLL